jgi:phosphopantetheine adenylyltransferase
MGAFDPIIYGRFWVITEASNWRCFWVALIWHRRSGGSGFASLRQKNQ